jgi:hypothetical protein
MVLILQTGCWWFVALTFSATGASARPSYGRGCCLVRKFDNLDDVLSSVWDTHVGKAVVILDVLIVEPRAVAGLPRCCAHHAKLGSASALCC